MSTAAGAIALLSLLAVFLTRPDLLIIALPLIVGTVLPLFNRAYRLPSVRIWTGSTTLLEGESTVLTEQLSGPETLDLARLQTQVDGWVQITHGGGDVCTTLRGGSEVLLSHELASTRWGRGRVEQVRLHLLTAHGLLGAQQDCPVTVAIRTLPFHESFTATELVPNAAGIVGGHRSRRAGEGVDLAGVRPFAVGDRLRRINWAVSSRTGQLHVTSTHSDRDTEVVLVLDTSVEIGYSTGLSGTSSNIDTAVRAAASIAEHYLRNGDRVGLLDLSRPDRAIRSRAGRQQLDRMIEILLEVKGGAVRQQSVSRALARISNRALVITLSPVLSDELASAVAELTRTGRSVVLVDTLPTDVLLPEESEWTDLAWRIQLAQRRNRIDALAERGIPVVPWQGSGSLDQVLIGLSRTAQAPRLRR